MRTLLACLIAIVALGCSRAPAPPAPAPGSPAPAAPPPAAGLPRIVALGDSLTAGYGLEPQQAWPALLQERLRSKGYAYELVNAGVTGDTSAGGLRRLDWSLDGDVRVLVVALGANDGLRGLPPQATGDNLARMVRLLKSRGARVVLVGIQMPPNYGPRYAAEFSALYQAIAARERVALVPFLLDGVAMQRSLMQDDNLHPNESAQPRMLENVWPRLRPLLRSAKRQHKAG